MGAVTAVKIKKFNKYYGNGVSDGKRRTMRNGATDLENLVKQNTTDEIPLLNRNVEIALGGRPGYLLRENYYDAKNGWPLNKEYSGKKYLTLPQMIVLKMNLLSQPRKLRRREDEESLAIILHALGEVNLQAEERIYDFALAE